MRCPNCGEETKERWSFCPNCGSRVEREKDLFSKVFERVENELREMDRAFERNFEVLDLSPFFRRPARGSGFSIKITRSRDEKPKVSVKTFGDVDRRGVEEEMGKLGFRRIKPEVAGAKEIEKAIRLEKAKITEEPETCVRRTDNKIVVEVKLPGVRDAKDIEVRSLENSIELKAIAGEKAYFKILTKPPKTSIVNKKFENGILRLELM